MAHGLWRGGAQESTLDMLGLLRRRGLDVTVLTCEDALSSFISDIQKLGVSVHKAPHRIVAHYPDIAVQENLVRSHDVVWISDIEYLVARRVKRIDRSIPVIAHIRSFELVCPESHAFYGHREMCMRRCSSSRIIRCKQLTNEYFADWGVLGKPRMSANWLLDFAKGPADFMTWPMKDAAEAIDAFIAVSDWVKDLVRTHSSELENVPIHVVHNPVITQGKADMKNQRDDVRRILYASGKWPMKGPHIAICAARKLLDMGHREFVLTMLGVKGIAWIDGLVRRLGMDHRIELLPKVDRNETRRLMARSSAILMPSLWGEPFGRVPVEANLLGKPAIVSNRGALPDLVADKITGLVAEPSPQAFGESIAEGLTRDWNRELILRIAKERFDLEHIVNEYTRFLDSFVSGKETASLAERHTFDLD